MNWVVFAVDTATIAFYALLIVAAVYLLYKLYKLIKSLGIGVFAGAKMVAGNLVTLFNPFSDDPQIPTIEWFTPHESDGSVAPIDVKPAGVDPIDWVFMDHSLSEAV